MRILKVSGDFKETSNGCNEFIEQLISYLKEDNNDYSKIKLRDNYKNNTYIYTRKPIFDKLTLFH